MSPLLLDAMRLSSECVPCLLKRVVFETKLVAPEKADEVESACRSILETGDGKTVSAEIASRVHAKAYEIIGSEDP